MDKRGELEKITMAEMSSIAFKHFKGTVLKTQGQQGCSCGARLVRHVSMGVTIVERRGGPPADP